jgi:hypothetical protein
MYGCLALQCGAGECMAAKRTPPEAKRKSSKTNAQPSQAASLLSMATNNLVNMIAVTTVSSPVLLTLLTIQRLEASSRVLRIRG